MTAYVAMLRGVNVGAKNRVAMGELRELVASLGYKNVRTYVQSGNVVFTGTGTGTKVAGRLAEGIRTGLELDVPVVVRTGDEMARALAANPFAEGGAVLEESKAFHVTFLGQVPARDRWQALAADAERFAPDGCRLVGADVYLHVPGERYSDSRLTNAYFEHRLGVAATTRNWRSVAALAAMAAA